jgi:hypothetical protein
MPRQEMEYNGNYILHLENGEVTKRKIGFYCLGRTAFIDQVNFINRPLKVKFTKIWVEEPIKYDSEIFRD